ncbi:hypothetical protein [Novilysobacter erysipheiresistens]|uniref:Uncharacterized protein n=1 Tax=Novilysobacter erysipheiresistens TaxID=1749332 RepID=A0ABU7Z2J3_9GAMM
MTRYRVLITATGMEIPPDGLDGFFTTRFVRSPSPEAAREEALRLVREAVAAEPAFAASPAPALQVELISRVWNPLKPSEPNSGFSFFGPDGGREEALEIERSAGGGWW